MKGFLEEPGVKNFLSGDLGKSSCWVARVPTVDAPWVNVNLGLYLRFRDWADEKLGSMPLYSLFME